MIQPANFDFADSADNLLPSEDFLDTFALALTNVVSLVTCRAIVDGTASICRVLRNVRRYTASAFRLAFRSRPSVRSSSCGASDASSACRSRAFSIWLVRR